MGGLLLKIGGPIMVVVGLLIYHNVAIGKVEKQVVEITEAKQKVEREKTSLESAIAKQATIRAKAVADAVEAANTQWFEQLERERILLEDIQVRNKTLESKLAGLDAEIEDRANENEEMRQFGELVIANGWIDIMLGNAPGESLPTG